MRARQLEFQTALLTDTRHSRDETRPKDPNSLPAELRQRINTQESENPALLYMAIYYMHWVNL